MKEQTAPPLASRGCNRRGNNAAAQLRGPDIIRKAEQPRRNGEQHAAGVRHQVDRHADDLGYAQAYNRIVEEGLPTEELHALASRVMDLAVMPFVLGLGVNFNIVVTRSSSQSAGAVAGLAVVAIGFLSLYGWRVVGWANHRQIGAFKEFNDQSPDSA
jgi:hypothetical protein